MKTSTNPIKPRSQMQRYSWLRENGVLIEGHGFFHGKALDAFVDARIHENNVRKREQAAMYAREAARDDVPAE